MRYFEGIGAALRRLRLDRDISAAELARRTDLSQPTISKIERELQRPSLATLDALLVALEATPEDLCQRLRQVDRTLAPAATPLEQLLALFARQSAAPARSEAPEVHDLLPVIREVVRDELRQQERQPRKPEPYGKRGPRPKGRSRRAEPSSRGA